MKKDALIFVKHILESIDCIEQYSHNISKAQFLEDKKAQDAILRRLEIIGEAVKNLPEEFTKKYPAVPWSEIARTRDKLIHQYFGVDLDLTFDIVRNDLPKIKKELRRMLEGQG